jgi:hypothetical protein
LFLTIARVATVVLVLALSAAAAGTAAQAAPAYIGRWKLNPAASDVAAIAVSVRSAADGALTVSGAVLPNGTFPLDGNDHPTSTGHTVSWTQVNARTWSAVSKSNGALITTDTLVLNERTLTVRRVVAATSAREDFSFTRQGVGAGLFGTWQARHVRGGGVTELVENGVDGVIIRMVTANAECAAKFDGHAYPLVGPAVPAGTTMTLTRTGPASFDVDQRKGGSQIVTVSYEVSGDGKKLTTVTTIASSGQTIRLVYDRQ